MFQQRLCFVEVTFIRQTYGNTIQTHLMNLDKSEQQGSQPITDQIM